MTKHGHTRRVNGKVHKSLTYQSWSSMNDRCYMDSHRWFHLYGGRGIEVFEAWRRGTPDAFSNFLMYLLESEELGERPSKCMTLDRIEANGHYEPGNIRWASKGLQRFNQRGNA